MKEEFLDLASRTQRQRGFGDFYGFVLVAQGSGELMVEHGVHAWDVAAIKPIVEEAGGRFTDWDGRCRFTDRTCSSATANCTTRYCACCAAKPTTRMSKSHD